ncbi:methyltransferase [Streptomyces sp. NL15-2K]|uniref:methyltransferase n=1 Tax=Streptomyces sp. NL15-2K TaxID=376149 RepID=UPI000F5603BB|nr:MULTISPECIES: class I SAM-dependent methyltransferase [Actinomycetes]WKX10511.1 class I SAM-dependent methyltransferase [Kutzneria buriramensis]GCB47955.1 methyltransferase type 12 [Streptomyces sp. NL15-2K]
MEINSDVTDRQLLDTAPAWMSLMASFSTGLLESLLEDSGTAEDFASRLGLVPYATEMTLELLASYGFVHQERGEFRASDALRRYDKDTPGGLRLHLALSAHAGDFLRSGKPFLTMDGSLEERQRTYRQVAPGLRPIFADLARACAAALPPVTGEILDVGAGSGVWSLAFAEANPAATVTGLDLPEVAEGFRAQAEERGLGGRVRTVAGDYHTAAVPEGACELVILANILHLEPPDRARSLVARMWRAVRPGGRLIVVDTLRSGEDPPARIRTMYTMALAMRTAYGRVHTRADVERWLTEAGARTVREVRPPQGTRRQELTDILVATAGEEETKGAAGAPAATSAYAGEDRDRAR